MKRAEVWKFRFGPGWYVNIRCEPLPERHLPIGQRPVGSRMHGSFPTHAAALAHALAEVGLAPEDPGAWRCPMRATDPITTRHPRDDGWRCGHEAGHTGNHTLYSDEGDRVLFAGRWVHMAEVGLTKKTGDES